MRIQCTLEDFSDCWVEISEKWSRAEERQLYGADADAWIDMFHAKVLACNLRGEDGKAIVKPDKITRGVIDSMDVRLAGFVGASLGTACAELRNLGKVARRVSFNGPETAKPA